MNLTFVSFKTTLIVHYLVYISYTICFILLKHIIFVVHIIGYEQSSNMELQAIGIEDSSQVSENFSFIFV